MVLVYAAQQDFLTWTGLAQAPANITQLLRSASLAIRDATQLCYYPADPVTNLPTLANQIQAFNDATCAQASFMNSLSIDPLAGGVQVEGVESGISIGTAHINYADTAAASDAKAAALGSICPEAWRILADAQVIPTDPWVVG